MKRHNFYPDLVIFILNLKKNPNSQTFMKTKRLIVVSLYFHKLLVTRVKMVSFQIIQNVITVKFTLAYDLHDDNS